MKTSVSLVLLAAVLSGCGMIKVNGGAAEPAAEPAEPRAGENSAPATAPADPAPTQAEKKTSKGELQCESSFMGALQQQGAIERNGEVFVATANDGFSAEGLKAAVTSCYGGYGETPSPETLARADAAMKAQRDAALAAAKKWQMPEPAGADPTLEQAIKKDFLEKHPGSDVRKVLMTSGWKTNMDGVVPRNRYKDAVILMGVKGTEICMRVPANAAQAAKGGGFDSKLSHDEFTTGTVVPCN